MSVNDNASSMNEKMKELLVYALDNPVDEVQQAILEEALAQSPDLRLEKEQLLQMRTLIQHLQLPSDERLVNAVMDSLEHKQRTKNSLSLIIHLFPSVAAACIGFILLACATIYLIEADWIPEVVAGTSDLTIEEAYTLIN